MVGPGSRVRAVELSCAVVGQGLDTPGLTVRRAASLAGSGIDRTVTAAAVLLLGVEVLVLGSAVVARYGLHRPLLWSDELATTLLLWLVALGAAIAVRRGHHLRLTVALKAAPAPVRSFMDAAAALLAVLFALALLTWGSVYAAEEQAVISPALGIATAWRAAALPVAGLLMLHGTVARTVAAGLGAPILAGAAVVVAAVGAVLWFGGDWLADHDTLSLLVFFVGLLILFLAAGLPIAFSFGVATIAFLVCTTDTPVDVVLARMDGGISSAILLAIPLFVLLGKLMEATGMAAALVGFLATCLGHVRGGLSYALLAAMYVVSGISGAKTADMAAVAPVLFPEMRRRGADEGELVSLLAASAVMSETIPPSLVLIAFASSTGISVSALFRAGLLPAALAAIALLLLTFRRARNEQPGGSWPGWRSVGHALLPAIPGLLLPFIIRAAVVEGVATATEVSVVGITYVVVVAFATSRRFPWRQLPALLVDTATLSGALLLILGTANAMAWALTQSGFSDLLADALRSLPGGPVGFLLASVPVFVVFGSVLEGLPAIALFGPLLFPIARHLGVHDVQFAIVAILAMGIGLYMPPFGVGYYSACVIGGVDPDKGMRRVWPYLGVLLAATLALAIVPALSGAR